MLQRTHRLVQWLFLGTLVGVVVGAASALFLWLLGSATSFRTSHEWVVFALPLAGLLMGLWLQRWGGPVRGGNNLVIDTVHEGSDRIPLSVAPSILGGTVLTHLFGGSGGREGAAVQMGAALAEEISHRLRVDSATRTQLLAAGVAGGFGAVFGTPIAGTLFGLEVVHLGRIEYRSLVPALVAAVVGDYTVRSLGIRHEVFPRVSQLEMDPLLAAKWLLVGVLVAFVAIAFVELTHVIRHRLEKHVRHLPIRMFLGGLAVILLWRSVGTSDYLGLGTPVMMSAFQTPSEWWTFALKLLFTAVTLGAGFLGGEVTPLFFIGATLGSALAGLLGLPLDLTAGVCMAAMFAAASNTPLALSVMAVELMGRGVLPHVVIVCVIAYLMTGSRSIYPSQRLNREKGSSHEFEASVRLKDMSGT